jgi:hypothetical protein
MIKFGLSGYLFFERKSHVIPAYLFFQRRSQPAQNGFRRPNGGAEWPMQHIPHDCMLHVDYFANDSTYTPKYFWHRFRMNKELFMKLVYGAREYDEYFLMRKDCTGCGVSHLFRNPLLYEACICISCKLNK